MFSNPDGYSMTMPAGWTAIAVGPDDMALLLNLLGTSSPDLASLVQNILDLTHGRPSMVGADLRDTSLAVPPNVTVLIQPSLGLSLDLVAPVVEQVVNRIPGVTGGSTNQKVTLPSGDAVRIDYQVQPASGGATISLRTFVIVRGSQTFLFTFTAASDRFADQQTTFDEMINSLSFST